MLARKDTRRSSNALVDSAIVTVAAGLLWWVFVIAPTWSSTEGSTAVRIVAAACPMGDLVPALVAGIERRLPAVLAGSRRAPRARVDAPVSKVVTSG